MPEYHERAPGVYRAKFVALDEEYPITVRETGEEAIRWRWVFQETADPTTAGEMDTITTPGFKARSNALKLFSGMLGRAPRPGDNTDNLIGQEFDVVYGPNQNGRNTVTGATRPTPQAPQNTAGLTASDELAAHREARAKAADQKALQEGETATFRGTEVPVTDPDELPF